jgi:hypothetical protein
MEVPAITQRKDLFTIYRRPRKENVEFILSASFSKMLIFFRSRHSIYHCKYHKKIHGGCKARVKSNLDDAIFTRQGDAHHNHPHEPDEQKLLRLVNMVVDAAAIDRRKPRIVFDAVRRK